MLQLSSYTKYYWYNDFVDMRKGIYGLCGLVQNNLKQDITQGDVFVFLNRKCNTLKLLQWDKDGFCLYEKKLSEGTFERQQTNNLSAILLTHYQLNCILQGVVLKSIKIKKRFGR